MNHSLYSEGLEGASNTLVGSKKGNLPIPKTDDELWLAVRKYFGVEIPRQQVCKYHVAPFTAFANAFFARDPVAVWKASRGFGGKSMLLALLAQSESAFLGAHVNLLGGSSEQSERVLGYMDGTEMPNAFWGAPNAPTHLILGGEGDGLQKRITRLTNGGYLKALAASTKSVRGPHPQRLRLDEVDEMDLNIFDSALGQPMKKLGIEEHIVASSTHHYANGTMTEILKRAVEKGWGMYEWCYRENLVSNGGWLEDEVVGRKKQVVTIFMWDTEYENQEPNPTGRAIDPAKCAISFDKTLGEVEGEEHVYYEFEKPYGGGDPEPYCHNCKHPYDDCDVKSEHCMNCYIRRRKTRPGVYCHGTDWAKKKDWTVVTTMRIDVTPARIVAWERTGRMDWPAMTAKLDDRQRRYGGGSMHDMTGVGDAVGDMLEVPSEGVLMQGMPRHEMISQYVAAIEREAIKWPYIKWVWDEHRLASVEDFYSSDKKHHLPDSVASAAICWKAGGLGMAGDIYVPGVNCMTKMAKGEDEIAADVVEAISGLAGYRVGD